MRLHSLLGLLGLGFVASASNLRPRNYESHDYYVLHLDPTTPPSQIASELGLTHEGQLGELSDHHIFSGHKQEEDLVHGALKERKRRKRSVGATDVLDGVKFAQKQKLKPRMDKRAVIPPRPAGLPSLESRQDKPVPQAVARQALVAHALGIQDPIFDKQWHLFNAVQVGHDVNVTDVWLQGITGFNATVAIVDDGLDMYSDDLKDNYFAEGSYDFNDHKLEPKPELPDDRHGTRCAGEVSAVKNNVCGLGVAYNSKVAGIRILSKLVTDADEAIAMNYAYQQNQIYSCSWGPPDDGKTMDAPGILIKKAMVNGVQNGRQGKGSIYVFASGNGASNGDNCNFDGYTNSIYSITVGAVDRKGLHPYYSEKCSAQLVVTYSSGSNDFIVSVPASHLPIQLTLPAAYY
jgi:kexin